METTDLHGNLMPYDYYNDCPDPGVGLVQVARLVDRARSEAANSALFDNGDYLQGTPLADLIAQGRGLRPGEVHPVIAAMNALGVDAATLGNHEFNYGLAFLERALEGATFPVVSANLVVTPGATPLEDRTFVAPHVLLDRLVVDGAGAIHPIRIGVIGFAPPPLLHWEQHQHSHRLHARDIVEVAQIRVPELRRAGADIVIALAHTGIGAPDHAPGMEHAAVPLAGVPGIDALLAGHSHQIFPGPDFAAHPEADLASGRIAGTPAVMAGFHGSHLGLIDLRLRRAGRGWRVVESRSEVRPVASEIAPAPPCRPHAPPVCRRAPASDGPAALALAAPPIYDSATRVEAAVAESHAETLREMRRPIGATPQALHSYFVLLGHGQTLQIVAEAQAAHVARVLQGTAHEGLPVLSATAPFKAGGRGGPRNYVDIPAGQLCLSEIASLYPFPNTVAALAIDGATLRAWLERSASIYRTLAPGGGEVALLDAEVPSYNFDMIAGVEYEIDLTSPPRFGADGRRLSSGPGRIRDLRHAGLPVADDDRFVIATNSFRAGRGGRFPGTGRDAIIHQSDLTSRELVCRHVAARRRLLPVAAAGWRLRAPAGRAVLFDTGPGARDHLDEIAGLSPSPLGLTPEGFLRLRLTF